MLEYFTYKKYKKHQEEKKHSAPSTPSASTPPVPAPVLTADDEHFLQRIVSAEGTPPPLPERPPHESLPEAGNPEGNKAQMVVGDKKKGKGKGKENDKSKGGKSSRFSFLSRNGTKKDKTPDPNVTPEEASKEAQDINQVLEDLNLSAVNNRAFSLSKESQELVRKFTVVLKDLINGVPTAYDDLVHLLDSSSGTLNKSYDSLPDFIKKLITQLPDKIKGNLAPELLAVAAEAQGFGKAGASSGGFSAKSFLKPTNLKDLVTKPGAVVSLLKAIMNALKLRWPAFMGTNVLLSLALFVLLFVFWYCHKRGREVRLEREAKVDSEGRIIELDDDPMLEGAAVPSASASRPRSREPRSRSSMERPRSSRQSTDRSRQERTRERELKTERK